VHDEPVDRAGAGQRVAVNLARVRAREVARGDVLAAPGAVAPATVLDCALGLRDDARHGERVHVHHGTRDAPGRLAELGDGLWQLRLDRPLLVAAGDRVVVRRPSPPDTLGGGVVLDPAARRHGRRAEVLARLARLRAGEPEPPLEAAAVAAPAVAAPLRPAPPAPDTPAVAALEERLRAAGAGLLSEAQLASDADALRVLRTDGRAVRVSGRLYAHADVVAAVTGQLVAALDEAGSLTLAEARDALGLSRKTAQAFLEHLDAQRVTRRLPDDRRVLTAARGVRA
jgi:selenocysteine-specific elongation factor